MEVVIGAFMVIAGIAIAGSLVLSLLNVCEPHEVLVFSGGAHRDESGKKTGFRTVFGGVRLRMPIIEKVDSMDLRIMPIEITVDNALSEGGIPLTIHAIANVKISSDETRVRNAIERFLGVPQSEIERVCKENLEGILRGVVGKMTPEEVNHDRMKFAGIVYEEVTEDLEKLGLEVDTLKIQSVHDDVDYLNSIGRAAIAQAHKEAEVAESDAARAAEEAEADAEGSIRVAQQKADMAIKERTNQLSRIKNELDGRISVEIERTAAAAREARAQAEKRLQEVRTELEQLRLQADVVIPAQAQQASRALLASGEASIIQEKGRATADVVDMINTALADAQGREGMDIFILQKIDSIMEQLVRAVEKVKVGSVTLVDSGDGRTLPAYVGSYPMMVGAVMGQLKELIGLDVAGALKSTSSVLMSAGSRGNGRAPEADPDDPVENDLTPPELLSEVVTLVARERKVGDAEKKIFTNVSRLLGIDEARQQQIVESVLARPLEPPAPEERPLTPSKVYAAAYRLAIRDRKLKLRERDILAKLARAMSLDESTQKEIQAQLGVTGVEIEEAAEA